MRLRSPRVTSRRGVSRYYWQRLGCIAADLEVVEDPAHALDLFRRERTLPLCDLLVQAPLKRRVPRCGARDANAVEDAVGYGKSPLRKDLLDDMLGLEQQMFIED